MTTVYRWLSTMGEEVLVLPVGPTTKYNSGRVETTLVPCLVLYSEAAPTTVGTVIKFATATLKGFTSLEDGGKVSS